jgi:2,4-dienoyl-CoA reductase-like NADH-dependent reductase (Old Yellow Enzyme family)
VSAVGLLTTTKEFEQVVAEGHADVVFAGREFLRDRMLPRRAAVELGVSMAWPRQYRMARFAGAIP